MAQKLKMALSMGEFSNIILIHFDEYNTVVYCTLIFVFPAFYLQQLDKELMQQILKEDSKGCTIPISVLNLSQRKCLGKYGYVGKHSEETRQKKSYNFTTI